MSFKHKLISAFTLTLAIVSFSTFAAAQDTNVKPEDSMQKQERRERRGFGKRGGGFGKRDGMAGEKRGGDKAMMRGLRGLNLTDAQKEQTRGIYEKHKTSTQTQREEMRGLAMKKRDGIITTEEKARMKDLKAQMRISSEQVNKEVLAVLTSEQRVQLDQMKDEMRKKREKRRQNRQAPTAPVTDN
ncbi:MAG: Spy/CpxP family protein refolding chaperone [Acidobacteria bacterium]|jgi:Spy/CpxP family protein refolding chaperone|nr:Spy/CpxP family protein refolding chaperone [Acidobacteriota bacterium]